MFVKEKSTIYECEVLSSTDWVQNSKHVFVPNHYENISKFLQKLNDSFI